MSFIRDTMASLDTRYMIRAYLIGLAFLVFMIMMFANANEATLDSSERKMLMYVYYPLCTALFPFAKFVWDEIRSVIAGGNVLMYSGFMLFLNYFMKFVVNLFIWGFAIFIAPVGILYLWFMRTRNA